MRRGPLSFSWKEAVRKDGATEWEIYVDEGNGPRSVARGMTLAEALEGAFMTFNIRVLDKADFPPGKIAHFSKDANLVRNVAVLRTGLHSLYEEIKSLESRLPEDAHSAQQFDVNGMYAQLAVKFDWFSVSMLNLMEGVSLLDTLANVGNYHELASIPKGMDDIRERAREYTNSILEVEALRLWRDKIAAHRSGIMPPPKGRPEDSMTTKLISLGGIQVGAKNGRYVAPGMIPGTDSLELKEWSLTETWESLVSGRYQWLNDGSFFDDVNSWTIGPGAHLYGMDVRNLDLSEQQMEELREQIEAGEFPSILRREPD